MMGQAIVYSTETDKLHKAIFDIQQECPFIGKDSTNPHFKSKYASLEDIWSTLRPFFFKHRVMVSQVPGAIEAGNIEVITQLVHLDSGQFILARGFMPLGKEGPQAAGSAITYARRYFLCPLLGIVAGEDDDAEQAEGRSISPNKLVDLRKRKEAILEFAKASVKDSAQKWFSDVLGRKVAENLALGSEEEVVKLEAEVNRIKKLGLT
jgi:hypothetical protein